MKVTLRSTRSPCFSALISLIMSFSWGSNDGAGYRLPEQSKGSGQHCEFYNRYLDRIEYFL
jgi:hypothetical protein